jgi:VWFA-related protein
MRRTLALSPLLVSLSGVLLVASQNPPPAQSLFRAAADLVVVDFLAVDANAQPAVGLTQKELVLLVDGRVREIRALQFVKVSTTSVETPISVPGLPLPYGTNDTPVPGRNVIIVIDHEQIRPVEGKPVFEAASRFIDRLSPLDRVGVVTLPNGNIEADLTTNHERVRTAIGAVVGRAMRMDGAWNISVSEAVAIQDEQAKTDRPVSGELIARECDGSRGQGCPKIVINAALQMARELEIRTRASLVALRTLFEGVAGIEGPKTVVFLSGSLVPNRTTPFDFEDVAKAAAVARIQLYVLQPNEALVDVVERSPKRIFEDMDLRRHGLEDLAANAGGVFMRLSGAGDNVFTRVADEISAYYLIGFSPQGSERDGKRHKIEVRTSRPQVTIRARPAFVVTGQPADAKAAPPEPKAMLRDYGSYRDLPLRAAAFPFREGGSALLKIIVAAEPADSKTTLNSAAFALIDAQGRRGAEWTEAGVNVVIRPLVTAAAVPPGDYRLRVAVVDTEGRRGAADYEFSARLTDAGPLQVGSIMLGTVDGGAFKPSLLVDSQAQAVTAYTEIYGAPAQGAALTATYELAARPDGPPVVLAKGNLLPTREPDRHVATGSLPLVGVAAGDYVVRLIVSLNGKEIGRVFRTLRKSGS